MYKISTGDFDTMVGQLLGGESVSYDMLCYIAEETLRPTVSNWCRKTCVGNSQELENEIMQEIHIRLIKTCLSGFLLRNGCNGSINNDPEGFTAWMFTLASNIKADCFKRMFKTLSNERNFEEDEEDSVSDVSDSDTVNDMENVRLDTLKKAFSTVIESDSQVYKILTWIAQSLFILRLDVTKIQSNELIIREFGNKTLFDMRDNLAESAKDLPWLEISQQQSRKIELALQKQYDENRVMGQIEYKEFFMKKGAKATVSDWMNRMNNVIKRAMPNESFNG